MRAQLLSNLYGTLPIFIGGSLNTVLVAALVASRHPTWPFLLWFALEVVVCAVRAPVLIACRRAHARGEAGPIDLYVLLSLLWAAALGYGTFISVTSGDWVVAALACLSGAAMVGGICFRNFAAPRLVAVMVILSLGPCMIAAPLTGQPILLVALWQIPFYLYAMTAAAYRLNRMLVGTMRAEIENGRLARHDNLTGLLNRAGLADHVVAAGAAGSGDRLALAYVDLDGFKTVNDSLGHAAGDELLRSVAARLVAAGGPGAVAARIGGDEFVLMAEAGDAATAFALGETLVAALADTAHLIEDSGITIGASAGLALFADHGPDLSGLLRAADFALYEAKSRGRCHAVVAPSGPREMFPPRAAAEETALTDPSGSWRRLRRAYG